MLDIAEEGDGRCDQLKPWENANTPTSALFRRIMMSHGFKRLC